MDALRLGLNIFDGTAPAVIGKLGKGEGRGGKGGGKGEGRKRGGGKGEGRREGGEAK